jgi:hypothetical protein
MACKKFVATLFLLALGDQALSQNAIRAPLPPDHLLVGSWRIDVPRTTCHEIYRINADGTLNVTSGEQISESEFDISLSTSSQGFYKWVDKITKDNGKPDCTGSLMTIGNVATNFILVHPSGRQFLMCQSEELKTCFGPFIKQD